MPTGFMSVAGILSEGTQFWELRYAVYNANLNAIGTVQVCSRTAVADLALPAPRACWDGWRIQNSPRRERGPSEVCEQLHRVYSVPVDGSSIWCIKMSAQ